MSTESRTNGTGPEQLEAEVERKREELADTVDDLHARLDVPSRAKRKAADLKDRATTDSGRPRTAVLAAVAAATTLVGGLVALRLRRSR